jgi:hypothetical protein
MDDGQLSPIDDGSLLPLGSPSIDFNNDPVTTTTSAPTQTPPKVLGHGSFKPNLRNDTHRHGHHNNLNDPARWRVPTILALTVAIGLGTALAIFLAIVAWRRVRKLRELRRRDAAMREIGQ